MTDGSEVLALWDALTPKLRQMIREETRSAVRKKKMNILSLDTANQTVTVYEAANPGVTITIPYRKESGIGGMETGQSVMVEWTYDDMSTAVAATPGQGWSGDAVEGYDSGWQTFPLTSAFTDYDDTNILQYRRMGNVVELVGQIKPTAEIASGATATIGTLPSGFRPGAGTYSIQQGSSRSIWLLYINSYGTCIFSRYGTNTYAAAPTTAWLPIHITFLTDNDIPTEQGVTIILNGTDQVTLSGVEISGDSSGNITFTGATVTGSGGNITIGGA